MRFLQARRNDGYALQTVSPEEKPFLAAKLPGVWVYGPARTRGSGRASLITGPGILRRSVPILNSVVVICVLCHLGDSEFDDRLSWNFDLLLRLGINARAILPPLPY